MKKATPTRILARILKRLRLDPDWPRWTEARRIRALAQAVEETRPELLPPFPDARLAYLRKASDLL
jgi:hypothetical protein